MKNMLSKIGKRSMPGKSVAALGALGIMGLGAADTVGPTAADAMMEVGLGNPEADQYFLGSDSSFRYLAGTLLGGNLGSAMRATALGDYLRENPYSPTAGVIMGGSALGTAVGAGAGFGLAQKALRGSEMGFGKKSLLKGAASIVGAATGFSVGFGGTAVAPVATHASQNRQFLSQSPYSGSRSTASSLNASGNIVLGMHNSRRGY